MGGGRGETERMGGPTPKAARSGVQTCTQTTGERGRQEGASPHASGPGERRPEAGPPGPPASPNKNSSAGGPGGGGRRAPEQAAAGAGAPAALGLRSAQKGRRTSRQRRPADQRRIPQRVWALAPTRAKGPPESPGQGGPAALVGGEWGALSPCRSAALRAAPGAKRRGAERAHRRAGPTGPVRPVNPGAEEPGPTTTRPRTKGRPGRLSGPARGHEPLSGQGSGGAARFAAGTPPAQDSPGTANRTGPERPRHKPPGRRRGPAAKRNTTPRPPPQNPRTTADPHRTQSGGCRENHRKRKRATAEKTAARAPRRDFAPGGRPPPPQNQTPTKQRRRRGCRRAGRFGGAAGPKGTTNPEAGETPVTAARPAAAARSGRRRRGSQGQRTERQEGPGGRQRPPEWHAGGGPAGQGPRMGGGRKAGGR